MNKVCSVCNIEKPLEHFKPAANSFKQKTNPRAAWQTQCKSCVAKRARFRYRIRATWAKKKASVPAISSETKFCGKCGETKSVSFFRFRHGVPMSPCKACLAEYMKKYHAEHDSGRTKEVNATQEPLVGEVSSPQVEIQARGRPKTNFKAPNNAADTGTKLGETRFTFIVNKTDLEAIKALAHFHRTQIKDVLGVAIKNHLAEKNGEVVAALVKYRSRTPYQGVDLTPENEQKPSVWRKLFGLGT